MFGSGGHLATGEELDQMRDHGGRRSVRSVARSVDRVDRFGNFANFSIFSRCRGARDLSGVKVSAPYDVWRPKKRRKTKTKNFGFFVKVDSIDSIIVSIRSIVSPLVAADRPAVAETYFSFFS